MGCCMLFVFFLLFFSLLLLFIPPGGEREKKMGREWKGANLWEMVGRIRCLRLGQVLRVYGRRRGDINGEIIFYPFPSSNKFFSFSLFCLFPPLCGGGGGGGPARERMLLLLYMPI